MFDYDTTFLEGVVTGVFIVCAAFVGYVCCSNWRMRAGAVLDRFTRANLPPVVVYNDARAGPFFLTPRLEAGTEDELRLSIADSRWNVWVCRVKKYPHEIQMWRFDEGLSVSKITEKLEEFGFTVPHA